jgi:hypothetical protein
VLTAGVARRLLRFEHAVEPLLGPLAACRLMIIIEKTAAPGAP